MLSLTHLGSNQTVIRNDNGIEILFSYNTPVAAFVPEHGYIKTEKFHSKTTLRHILNFLGSRLDEYAKLVPQEYLDSLI